MPTTTFEAIDIHPTRRIPSFNVEIDTSKTAREQEQQAIHQIRQQTGLRGAIEIKFVITGDLMQARYK